MRSCVHTTRCLLIRLNMTTQHRRHTVFVKKYDRSLARGVIRCKFRGSKSTCQVFEEADPPFSSCSPIERTISLKRDQELGITAMMMRKRLACTFSDIGHGRLLQARLGPHETWTRCH